MYAARTRAWFSHHGQRLAQKISVDTDDLVKQLLDSCHTQQRNFVTDASVRVCALVARGGGKTTAGRVRFLIRMLTTDRARCCFIATSRQQAEEFMWGPLKDLCETLGIQAVFNETKLKCTFIHNGSSIRLVGADDKKSVDKLRGQPFHEVGIDESASYGISLLETLIDRVIEPRLGDFNGTLWTIGTPGHILAGRFYELTREGSTRSRAWLDKSKPEFEGWDGWSFHHWSMEDGAREIKAMANLWSAAQTIKERNKWSDDTPVWRREYLGWWAADDTEAMFKYRSHTDAGDLWNCWDPELDMMGFAKLPDTYNDWEYSYGQDMGHSDPYSCEVFAWSPSDPTKMLYHVYEFTKTEMYARLIAELLLGANPGDGTPWPNHSTPKGCYGVTGWPVANVADTAGLGGTVLNELKEVYGITVKPAQKRDKHDAIELFNGDLIDGRIKIMKGSHLETQLLKLQWAVDDFGILKEHKGMRNDCADAAIYARREAHHLISEAETEPEFRNRRIPEPVITDSMDAPDNEYSEFLNDSGYSMSDYSEEW